MSKKLKKMEGLELFGRIASRVIEDSYRGNNIEKKLPRLDQTKNETIISSQKLTSNRDKNNGGCYAYL